MMAAGAAAEVLSLVLDLHRTCQDVIEAKSTLKAVGRQIEVLIPVLRKIEESSEYAPDDDATLSRALREIDLELTQTKRAVDKAKKMNKVLYVVKAKSVREDIDTHLRRVQLSLAMLEAGNTVALRRELNVFREEWREREGDLLAETARERLRYERLMNGNVAENISGVADIRDREELADALREMERERDEVRQTLESSRDSASRAKAELEELDMAQIVAALLIAERNLDRSNEGKADDARLPECCYCPVTFDVLLDPINRL
mmetsp:Transcript_2671/g.4773  ORF Transcript_2671/g.4773 Transcript_2671/m.4773 type:complete len:262 (+) Transcript_2671:3-788(+)